jgi:hypothetical protein
MAKPVRRNIAHLTDAERQKYITAVVQADQRFWSGGVVSFWDFQDLAHQTTHVHGGPKFLLWHRELCNRYEALLQQIDPDVALHYWDWTTDPRSSPNGSGGTTDLSVDTFMGTMNTGVGVISSVGDISVGVTGALRPLHNGGVLAGSRDQTGQPQDPPQTLRRNMRAGPGTATSDATILSSSNGFAQAQQWRQFRQSIEGVHGGVHVNFGPGNIGDPSGHQAFNDPMVFLLHANVDRLYAMWQCQPGQEWRLDVTQVYGVEASTTGEDGLSTNTLAPWDGSSGVHPFNPTGGLTQVKPYLDPSLVVPPCYDTNHNLIRGVMLAGKFRTHRELNAMSHDGQRNTLITELSGRTNLSPVGAHFQAMDDPTLAGTGGVLVFLREAKIRDDSAIKTMSDDELRNIMIVEIGAQTHLPGPVLQGMSNMDLVLLGLGVC